MCKDRQFEGSLGILDMNAAQDALEDILRHLRGLIEVCPRGQHEDQRAHWQAKVEAGLQFFDLKP